LRLVGKLTELSHHVPATIANVFYAGDVLVGSDYCHPCIPWSWNKYSHPWVFILFVQYFTAN
jgi:hypothetical protein